MKELLDAVDALTEPSIEHIAQIGDDGLWLRAHTVELPPLLQRLADAVNPSSNTTAGSSSTPSTRAPLDFHALFEFAKISSAIRTWCRKRHLPVTTTPNVDVVVDLQTWRDSVKDDMALEGTFFIRELERWMRLITALLNPGEVFEAKVACPICGATAWGDAINGGGLWSVAVMYRLDERDRMQDERALCRSCNTIWAGHESVMELAEEANEKPA